MAVGRTGQEVQDHKRLSMFDSSTAWLGQSNGKFSAMD